MIGMVTGGVPLGPIALLLKFKALVKRLVSRVYLKFKLSVTSWVGL